MRARRVWAVAREALLLELAVYQALLRWVTRRPDVPPGGRPIGYAALVVPVLWLWVFGSATEVVVLEVVLRQIEAGWAAAIRVPLLVVGVWGVIWMVGLLAAHRVRPHVVTEDLVLVRGGLRTWVEVPMAAVASVRAVEQELPSTMRTLHHEGDRILLGVSGRTNLELVLAGPTPIATSKGDLLADRVGLWVDDPRAVSADLAGGLVDR